MSVTPAAPTAATGGVVHGPGVQEVAELVAALARVRFASRLAAGDAGLWGPAAREEAARRLGWLRLPVTSRPLVDEVTRLRAELAGDGLDHVVLAGMGGSSLAPEVMCRAGGVELTVVDSTDPQQVRRVLADRLERTVLVVASKSGTTAETDAQRRAFEQAFTAAGLDPARRIIVVTDPGSPLEQVAQERGYRCVRADPQVGGRYSALSAFGLIPAGLAGVDVGQLLDEAASMAGLLGQDDPANPALQLGAALAGTVPLRDKIVLTEAGPHVTGLGDWVEQLVAESTGKQGRGLLPVVVAGDAPELTAPPPDTQLVQLSTRPATVDEATSTGPAPVGVHVQAGLGGQLLLWEYATAVAGRLLGINPFDQPDVESAKEAARQLLDRPQGGDEPPVLVAGPTLVRAPGGWLSPELDTLDSLADAVDALCAQLTLRPGGYLAVMAYLDRGAETALSELRPMLARRTGRPVTYGWGPRFLHSTGQYHKGGPPTGVFLQITADPGQDVPVPGRSFTFGQLIAAQAAGDAGVLTARGCPVLRVHLTDRAAGVAALLRAVGA